jgi:hypothetical protein
MSVIGRDSLYFVYDTTRHDFVGVFIVDTRVSDKVVLCPSGGIWAIPVFAGSTVRIERFI